MNKKNNLAASCELDDEFIYVSEHGCEKNEPSLNYNIEPLYPRLDVEHLFHSKYKQLKGFIRKRVHNEQDAEDIAQNTYLEALKKADNFKGLSRPDVWLFGIALNLVRNHSKKEKNRARMWEENYGYETTEFIEVENNPSDLIGNKQTISLVNKTLGTLPKDMAQVFNVIVVENKTYQEAAKIFGVPTGTIRSRLSRVREKLKDSV